MDIPVVSLAKVNNIGEGLVLSDVFAVTLFEWKVETLT